MLKNSMKKICLVFLIPVFMNSCASNTNTDEGSKDLALLKIRMTNGFNNSFITEKMIQDAINGIDPDYYFFKADANLLNAWWDNISLVSDVRRSFRSLQFADDKESLIQKDAATNLLGSLDKIDVSVKERQGATSTIETIKNYCLSAERVGKLMLETSGFRTVRGPLNTVGSEFEWLARYFYESLHSSDGRKIDECRVFAVWG